MGKLKGRTGRRQRELDETVKTIGDNVAGIQGDVANMADLNVKGTFFTVQKALPLLVEGGSVILIGSVASVKGTSSLGVYGATKAALRSFARTWTTWTTDLKERRVRTPLSDRQSPDATARIVSTVPMGRMGEPDEIARAALFLASDDSSFVTGNELFAAGGRGQV